MRVPDCGVTGLRRAQVVNTATARRSKRARVRAQALPTAVTRSSELRKGAELAVKSSIDLHFEQVRAARLSILLKSAFGQSVGGCHFDHANHSRRFGCS